LTKESEQIKTRVEKDREQMKLAEKEMQGLQLEYVQSQAKKYKLMSKKKH